MNFTYHFLLTIQHYLDKKVFLNAIDPKDVVPGWYISCKPESTFELGKKKKKNI